MGTRVSALGIPALAVALYLGIDTGDRPGKGAEIHRAIENMDARRAVGAAAHPPLVAVTVVLRVRQIRLGDTTTVIIVASAIGSTGEVTTHAQMEMVALEHSATQRLRGCQRVVARGLRNRQRKSRKLR